MEECDKSYAPTLEYFSSNRNQQCTPSQSTTRLIDYRQGPGVLDVTTYHMLRLDLL